MLSGTAAEVVAIGVLMAAVAAVAAWAWAYARPLRLGPLQLALFGLNQVLARVLWRASASGPLPVEPGQGAVIVCNHRAPFDPSFFYLTTSRRVHWMVASEYYDHPLLAWFFRASESIRVNRGGINTATTKAAIRLAKAGELVALFPEGRINSTAQVLLPGRPGAAMIALRARVPIVPCYVTGSPNDGTFWGFLFMPAKVRLKVGKPIDTHPLWDRANDREAAEELTRVFLRQMAALAGVAEFEPRLAGRFARPRLDEP
jgi:1-acyl-sn-glycerol-3-phosphate acyltransferase